MKKIYYIIIPFLFFAFSTLGQTYLQGESVIQFSDVARSKYITNAARLTMDQSYEMLKSVDLDPFSIYKGPQTMVGEYWRIDGMLIQLVTRYTTSYKDTTSLETRMYSSRPAVFGGSTLNGVKQPVDSSRREDFFNEIKSVNNFDVLVYYLRTLSQAKRFEIRDHNRKYIIRGTIYAKKEDFDKAHRFIDTLLESITFKE